MLFANLGSEDLASRQILNGSQIPKLTVVFEIRHITDPNEMRSELFCGNIRNEIGVVVDVGGDRAEVFVLSPRCFDPVELHHSLGALVVDPKMKRHFVLTICRMINMCLVDLYDQRFIFCWLYRMAVDIFTGDSKSFCPHGLDGALRNQLNFFSPSSGST